MYNYPIAFRIVRHLYVSISHPTVMFNAQWLLFVSPGLTFRHFTFFAQSVFMCFVWISEQTVIISVYCINGLVSVTETECVYCAVRTESLCMIQVNLRL